MDASGGHAASIERIGGRGARELVWGPNAQPGFAGADRYGAAAGVRPNRVAVGLTRYPCAARRMWQLWPLAHCPVQKMKGATCDVGHSPRSHKLASVALHFRHAAKPNTSMLKFENRFAKTTFGVAD